MNRRELHETVSHSIIGAAIEVHRALGPGLLESAYETCLAHELGLRGLAVERQRSVPVRYKGVVLETQYRLDLLVEGIIVVELKAVSEILPVHEVQVLTYLRLLDLDVALLLNFNTATLRSGIRRILRPGADIQDRKK